MPPAITASLHLGPPSRNYFIAQTSSSQRSFPSLAHAAVVDDGLLPCHRQSLDRDPAVSPHVDPGRGLLRLPALLDGQCLAAVAQKSPCTCSLERRPLLTQLIELRLGLSQGSALHAEPLAMRSKALPFLSQVLRWSVAHRIEYLRLCWGPRQEFPGALALQRALREALLARGPQQ